MAITRITFVTINILNAFGHWHMGENMETKIYLTNVSLAVLERKEK